MTSSLLTVHVLKRQSRSELQQLSNFLQKRTDDELCEIIDVLTNCDYFKRKLIREGKNLNEDLSWSLETISDSTNKIEFDGEKFLEKSWEGIGEMIVKPIRVRKISLFQSNVGRSGSKWLKQIHERKWKIDGEALDNPLDYFIKILLSEKFGFDFDNAGGSSDYREYFEECEQRGSEEGRRLTHVFKSAYYKKGEYFVPQQNAGESWHLQKPLKSEIGKEFGKEVSSKLSSKGLVNEGCSHLGYWWGFSVESEFCKNLNELYFGAKVDEKLGRGRFSKIFIFLEMINY